MVSKKRDHSVTGQSRHAWPPGGPCPCESGRDFASCCRRPDGSAYKPPALLLSRGLETGDQTPGCYLSGSYDCRGDLSDEHYVSKSLLSAVVGPVATVSGVPWLDTGKTQEIPIGRLAAKVLCERHNGALSPLDAEMGRFIRALSLIYANLGETKSLSRKGLRFLFSGVDIERWFAKAALGLFHSGIAAREREKLKSSGSIHPLVSAALNGRPFHRPCGLYVLSRAQNSIGNPGVLALAPLSSDQTDRMVGLRLMFMGVDAAMLLDPQATYGAELLELRSYRPSYMYFRHHSRKHLIALSWPDSNPHNGILFDLAGRVRKQAPTP